MNVCVLNMYLVLKLTSLDLNVIVTEKESFAMNIFRKTKL